MARPQKMGLDYFPLDVEMDSSIQLLEAEFGIIAFAIIIKLFQKIYKNGYYIELTEDELLLTSMQINVDKNLINDVINRAIDRNIFNRTVFENYSILTSNGIQKRYLQACDRRKEILLIKEIMLTKTPEMSTLIELMTTKSTQSKVNNIILNNTKENYTKEEKKSISKDIPKKEKIPYEKIKNIFLDSCPNFPTIREMSDKRKKAFKKFFEYMKEDLQEIESYFKKANNTAFLSGESDGGWKANIDWLIKPEKVNDVLEGKYDRAKPKQKEEVDKWDNDLPF